MLRQKEEKRKMNTLGEKIAAAVLAFYVLVLLMIGILGLLGIIR
jgi:hypothetical protein